MNDSTPKTLLAAAGALSAGVDALHFAPPITHVYNPLEYAWAGQACYLEKFGGGPKQAVFVGMNPGPFGMAQTGVPFGEVSLVRDWLGIDVSISRPDPEHPKRLVEGFQCQRSEVSGQRLWGLFQQRFGTAEAFFQDHFVANYCPLVFMESTGRNRTPDKLPAAEVAPLYALCDAHLRTVVAVLEPEWVIGVGAFAEGRVKAVLADCDVKIGRILHPSPASPAANRGWGEAATKQLEALGVW